MDGAADGPVATAPISTFGTTMVALPDAPAWVDDAVPDIRAVAMASMRSSARTGPAPVAALDPAARYAVA